MSPDLSLDLAMALVPCRDADARRALERCFDAARAASDSAGERLAAAGAVIAIAADFADFRKLADWLERLQVTRRASWPRCDRPQDQARLDTAMICIPLLEGSIAADEPCIEAAAVRLAGLLAEDLPVTPEERMLLWKCLVGYRSHRLDTTELARIMPKAQDFMRGHSVSPLWQARWWLLAAREHEYFGAQDAAADSLRRANTLADEHGLTSVRYELLCVEMTAALKAEAWGRADTLARDIEILLPDVSAGRHRAGYYAQAWRLMWRGELEAALLRIDRVLAICDDLQVPLRDRGTYYVLRAYALMGLGRFDDAARDLESQRPHQLGDQSEILTALVKFATGFGELQRGQVNGRDKVLTAIDRCAALAFERFLLPLPRLAAEAARFALEAGRQTEFVTRAIRLRRLVPGVPTASAWPWRLQIHVLGTERILRDGHPLAVPGKRPKNHCSCLPC